MLFQLYTDTQGDSDSFSLAKIPDEESDNFKKLLNTNYNVYSLLSTYLIPGFKISLWLLLAL